MQISELLSPARSLYTTQKESKKHVLNQLSKLICQDLKDVEVDDIFSALVDRERLGSTAIGHGVAIPHVRSTLVKHPLGALLRLEHGIDFGATDKQEVDLFFALLVPVDGDEEHLQILAHIAKKFHDPAFREKLRLADEKATLYQAAING